jgi:hypothetical protein
VPLAAVRGRMLPVDGPRRIGHVDDRRAVRLDAPGERVGPGSGVMADADEHPIALAVRHRLVRAAAPQVVVADQPHVPLLGRVAAALVRGPLARGRGERAEEAGTDDAEKDG